MLQLLLKRKHHKKNGRNGYDWQDTNTYQYQYTSLQEIIIIKSYLNPAEAAKQT